MSRAGDGWSSRGHGSGAGAENVGSDGWGGNYVGLWKSLTQSFGRGYQSLLVLAFVVMTAHQFHFSADHCQIGLRWESWFTWFAGCHVFLGVGVEGSTSLRCVYWIRFMFNGPKSHFPSHLFSTSKQPHEAKWEMLFQTRGGKGLWCIQTARTFGMNICIATCTPWQQWQVFVAMLESGLGP